MPDLQFRPLREAARATNVRRHLMPFFGDVGAAEARRRTSRVQAPICFWQVYAFADRRVTLKSFFSEQDYQAYAGEIRQHYGAQVGDAQHPAGGILLIAELNGLLWGFPFDPAMPGLAQAVDGGWVGTVLGRGPLAVSTVNYNPEVGALLAYKDDAGEAVAYGKVASQSATSLVYAVMDRLWCSEARAEGRLTIAEPLAYRPHIGLFLQAAAAGETIGRDRNRQLFLRLAENAGTVAAALHGEDVPFGLERPLDHLLTRLRSGVGDASLLAPTLHRTLVRLVDQLEVRATRSHPAALVPSHGDYKYDQFLFDAQHDRFSLIDFELFCQAEPALDLGTFCAYVVSTTPADWRDAAAAEVLRGAFLRAYEGSGGQLDLDRLALYEAAMLGIRALAQVWAQQSAWQVRASALLDLAFERLVNPAPAAPAA